MLQVFDPFRHTASGVLWYLLAVYERSRPDPSDLYQDLPTRGFWDTP